VAECALLLCLGTQIKTNTHIAGIEKMKTLRIVIASILNIGVTSMAAASQPYWEAVPRPTTGNLYANNYDADVANILVLTLGTTTYAIGDGNLNQGLMRYTECGGWESLGYFSMQDGSQSLVTGISADGTDIYIVGGFDVVYGPNFTPAVPANHIVKYDTICGIFTAVGDGSLARNLTAVAVDSNHTIYVGCTWNSTYRAGTADPGMFLKWTGTSWVTVGNGLMVDPDPALDYQGKWGVTALAADGTNIYAAGGFAGGYNGGTFVSSTNVIKWTGSAFSPLGSGGVREINVTTENPFIRSIAILGTNVFFAGNFNGADVEGNCTEPPYGIFRFSTSGARLPCDSLIIRPLFEGGLPRVGTGISLTTHNGILYLGGQFDYIGTPCGGTIAAHSIAQWSNGSWSPVTGPLGEGLTIDNDNIAFGSGIAANDVATYVFGTFLYAGGVPAGDTVTYAGMARYVMNPSLQPSCPCQGHPGIVAWWPLEGNANDIIGGNNGTLTSGNYSFSQGEVNQAIFTTAKPGGVTVPDSASLNMPANTNFTIEAWIQPQSAATSYDVMSVVEKRYTPDAFSAVGYELCLISGKLAVQISDSLNVYPLVVVADSTADLRDTYWHHVAVSINRTCADGGRLYVDGVRVATFDPTSEQGDLTTTQPLLIGMHPDPSLDCNFRGGIDEVTLYKRALTDDQIAAIFYTGTTGKTCN
jgi:hypothetical protein